MNKKKQIFLLPIIALILGVLGGYFWFRLNLSRGYTRIVRENSIPYVQPDCYSKHCDFSIKENEKVYLISFTNKRTSNLARVKMDCYVVDEGHRPAHNVIKIGRQDLVKVLEYNKKQSNPDFPASSRIAFNVEGYSNPGWGFIDTYNIIEEDSDWWLIRTESGKYGWVPNKIFFNDKDLRAGISVKQPQSATKQYTSQKNSSQKEIKHEEKPKSINNMASDYALNQMEPKSALISFHKAITNKQLRTAYSILSPDYQRFMRSFDNFARGYATTLRSDVVDMNTLQENNNSAILSYKLKAEDQFDGGKSIQYFVGKAKLVKIDGKWRIDSTEAKKASQNSSLPTNTANATVSDTAFKKTVGTITGNDVNVRKGPGIDYKSLGVFFKGDKVRIVNSSRNSLNEIWYKIEFDNPTAGLIVGWVKSDFIIIN